MSFNVLLYRILSALNSLESIFDKSCCTAVFNLEYKTPCGTQCPSGISSFNLAIIYSSSILLCKKNTQ